MSDATVNPEPKPKISAWQKRLLVIVLVINLGLYGVAWYLGQDTSAASSSRQMNVAAGEPMQLREVYKQALTLALQWQSDAQLIGAATSWQVASGDSLTLHRSSWSFRFYSAAAQKVQIVEVDPQGAQAGRQQSLQDTPYSVVPDWDLGSDELLLTFLSLGGREFISYHPRANVHLQLKGEDGRQAVWYVTAVDPVVSESLTVGIDAISRQVVVSDGSTGGG